MTITLLVAVTVLLALAVAGLSRALVLERRGRREIPALVAAAAPVPAPAPAGASPAADHRLTSDDEARHVLGLLTHELRTPLGAIVGYEELLVDGLMGELPERALDAIRRIGTSGAQLRHLIDGLADLMLAEPDVSLELEHVDGVAVASAAATSARALAGGRGVELMVSVPAVLPQLVTDGMRLAALLDLAIGAAVRASPGARLSLTFAGEDGALLARVDGSALDPARDGPAAAERGSITTGAGLRLAMARRIASILGGDLSLAGTGPITLLVRVPPTRIDAAPAVV